MNIESQVCSLELAKRLKELGVKQESLIYWLNIEHCIHFKVKKNEYGMDDVELDEKGNPIIEKIDYRIELGNPHAYGLEKTDTWSAFTVAELGEMLPKEITDHKTSYLEITHRYGYWQTFYLGIVQMVSTNQADAYAKMLIYLIENKLIEIK